MEKSLNEVKADIKRKTKEIDEGFANYKEDKFEKFILEENMEKCSTNFKEITLKGHSGNVRCIVKLIETQLASGSGIRQLKFGI